MKLCIDPGHGGSDPGAVGGGLHEEDVTLSVGKLLAAKLKAAGHDVVLTRTTDKKVKNSARVKVANDANVDAFVAVHFNAAVTERAHGHEVIYCPNSKEGRRLAQEIHDAVVAELDVKPRGVKTDTATGRGPFTVLRKTKAPAVIVEVAFITNEEDRTKVDEATEHDAIAAAIVRGILAWFGETVTVEPVIGVPKDKDEAEQNLLNGWDQFRAIFKDGKLAPEEVPLLLTATVEVLQLFFDLLMLLPVDPRIVKILDSVIVVLIRLGNNLGEKLEDFEKPWRTIVGAFADGKVELKEIVPLLQAIVDLLAITWNILLPFVHVEDVGGELILKLKKVLEWLNFLALLARPKRSGPEISIT